MILAQYAHVSHSIFTFFRLDLDCSDNCQFCTAADRCSRCADGFYLGESACFGM